MIYHQQTFPHFCQLYLPGLSDFETPLFEVSFVDSKGGKWKKWKSEPDPHDQHSCKTNFFASALLEIIGVPMSIGTLPHT
jgi:hypothetical protein